jgi:hypothetical protein
MKVVLQCHFDHPLEHPVPKINKVAMASEKHSLCTKSVVHSSWSDSIVGDAGLTPSKHQPIAIKPAVKKVVVHATNLHGPQQQVLPLSSKSNDNINNIESDISAGTKLNQCSSWSYSIIGEECLSKLRVQDAKIKHPKKNLVLVESSSLLTTQGTVPTHGSICKEHKVPHSVEMPNNLLHCKRKNVVSSEHFASVNLHDTQSTTDIAPTPVLSDLEPFVMIIQNNLLKL